MIGKNEVIALEGPVCAGKTTLINGLVPLGYQKIPEYVDFALNNNLKLPKFPPQNETEAKASFEFYLDLEKRRQGRVEKGKWLLDRSKYTLLAFEAGARNLTQIDIFPWACNLVDQRKDEITEPDHTLYVDVAPEESKRRANLACMETPVFFFSPQFTTGFREAFILFQSQNPNRFTFIDGVRPYQEVLADISEIIRSNAGSVPTPASICK